MSIRIARRTRRAPEHARRTLLRPLGIVGYDAIEPAILAALASEEPLLLVSDHGAAKTLLLVRLAQALDLELRHYNASLLQFDDLAGFPVPDERGGIRYASSAGSAWGAQVIFFDEIGRCRPEVANKLFPIVHERRLQGIPLDHLRYRWAATNPPPSAQQADAVYAYDGVEPLDPALADRFAYIVTLPAFAEFSDADRRAVLAGIGDQVDPTAAGIVRELVHATVALVPTVRSAAGDALVVYADVLIGKLAEAKLVIGGRRAAMLVRNLVALRAAHLALGLPADERACLAAVGCSIPDIVRTPVPRSVLLAAHKAAWRETQLDDDDPQRLLAAVRDPLRRGLLAMTLPNVDPFARGDAIVTALASLPADEGCVLAWHLLPHVLDTTRLPATVADTVATRVHDIAEDGVSVRGYGTQRDWAVRVRAGLSQTAIPAGELEYLHGVVAKHSAPRNQGTGFAPPSADDVIQRLLQVRDTVQSALGLAHADGPRRAGAA